MPPSPNVCPSSVISWQRWPPSQRLSSSSWIFPQIVTTASTTTRHSLRDTEPAEDLRKKHRHEATAVRVQARAPQRVRQPTKRKTRRKTKAKTRQPAQTAHAHKTQTVLSQPNLLLAALRTAPAAAHPYEALRQMPGVDGSRLQRNMARLVEQRKIQETPAGYVVVST